MAGLINSNILRNPKIPLNRITVQPAPVQPAPAPYRGAVASTAQALTEGPTTYDDAGFEAKGFANTVGAIAGVGQNAGQGAGVRQPLDWDAWANTPWSADEVTPQQAAIDNAVSGTKRVASSAVLPKHDWAAWADTPWSDQEAAAAWDAAHPRRRVSFDDDGGSEFVYPEAGSAPGAGFAPDVAGTSAPEPEPTPIPDTEGDLSGPGTGEKGFDDTKDELNQIDPRRRELVDQIMNMTKMADPNFDPWYDREWKRMKGSLNQEAGARGMYNSGDAMSMLHQSRESLAADQAKAETDYANEAWKNDVGRYGLAAGLLGDISDDDRERWGLKQSHAENAQKLEEGRVRGYIDDTQNAGATVYDRVMSAMNKLSEDDMNLVLDLIMAGPAPSTEKANQLAKASEEAKAAYGELAKLYFGGGV